MIEIEKAIRDFEKYANKYDTENDNILRKIKHTYRVVDIAEEIAKNLNLENEELNLVKLIALFHDIGRFEQYTKYKTYNDLKSFDHGDYGVEVLTKKLVIDKYVDSEIEKNIVLKSVKNHNKYEIEKSLSKKELFFSKIIRDADKLDIIYEAKTIFFKSKEEMEEINNGTLSQEIMKYFYMKKTVKKPKHYEIINKPFIILAFVFDLNFTYSFQKLYEEDSINNILKRFHFKNEETIKKSEEIKEILQEYLVKRK